MTRVIATHPLVELVDQRDDHTRVWETAKEVETTHPDGSTTVETVKSHIHEKGSGLCYKDASGNYVPAVAEWREAPDGFVIDRCAYGLAIGRKIGAGMGYNVEGHELALRPAYLMVSDGLNEEHLALLNPDVEGFIVDGKPSVVRFPAAFGPGYDLEYVVEKGGFHQNLIIAALPQLPAGFDAGSATIYLYTEMNLDEYVAASGCNVSVEGESVDTSALDLVSPPSRGGCISFCRDGRLLHAFSVSHVTDASGPGALDRQIVAEKRLMRDSSRGAAYLVESLPFSYFIQEPPSYPVTWDYREVTEPITSNETWEPRYTYWISSDLDVSAALTILPGTTIKVSQPYSIYILSGPPGQGQIDARGEPYNYITFTNAGNGACGETIPGAPSGNAYYLLHLQSGSSDASVIHYCKLSNAFSAIDLHQDLVAPEGQARIANNVIRDCGWGVHMSWSSAACRNNLIVNCTYGIDIYVWYEAEMEIRNNIIEDCWRGLSVHFLYVHEEPGGDIAENLFTDCTYDIYGSGGPHPDIHDNRFHPYDPDFTFYNVTPGDDNEFLGSRPYDSSPLGDFFLITGPGSEFELNLKDEGSRSAEAAGLGREEFTMKAPHEVSGNQTSDVTWRKLSDPSTPPEEYYRDTDLVDIGYHHNRTDYYLTGDFKITSQTSAALTILPGTVVVLGGDEIGSSRYLTAEKKGKVVAVGDPANGGYNRFTRRKSASMFVESPHYTQTAVGQLRLTGHPDSRADFCRFERGACLRIASLNNPVCSNRFALTYQGLYAYGSQPLKVFNNLFCWNYYAYYQYRGYATAADNTFDGNDYGCKLLLNYTGNPPYYSILHDNLFTSRPEYDDPYQYGIHASTSGGSEVHENFNHFFGFQEGNECVVNGNSQVHATDVVLTTRPYEGQLTGYEADWFLDQTEYGSPPQPLPSINGGSRSAKYAGLGAYTTSSTAEKDVANVDIGYHHSHGDFADTDGDGMPEAWETEHTCYNPAADDDGDGLSNLDEYLHGADPDLQDTDGDGTNDGTEVSQGTMDPAHWSLYYEPYIIKMEYSGATQKCSLTVKWRSTQSYQGKIKYRKESDDWAEVQESASGTDHAVELGNLAPDMLHFYRVSLPAGASESWTVTSPFRTPPSTGSSVPFKFIVYGDNRTHPQRHRDVVNSILDNSFDVFDPPRFLLHSGDYTSTNTNDQWLSEFFKPVAGLLPAMPIYPCAGNHEYPSISQFRTRFPCDWYKTGSSDPCYLHFDYARCRVIVYDTQNLGAEQKSWLSARIDDAATDPNIDWIFVILHIPLYTDAGGVLATAHGGTASGGHKYANTEPPSPPDDVRAVREALESHLANKAKLKVVLCGHNHLYQRSFTQGADHVVTGGGGAPGDGAADHHRTPRDGGDTRYSLAYGEPVFHHCLIDVSGDDMAFRAIRNDGSVLDFDAHNTNGQRLWDGNPGPTTPVDFEAQWKYKQGTNLDGIPWQLPDYDDSAWSTGGAPLGFGWTGPGTQLTGTYPTYYFRHTIAEDLSGDLTSIEFLFLELHLDDGCAVYLNGSEVFRSNLAPGATYWTGAQNSVDSGYDEEPLRCLIDHSSLRAGSNANVVAVEVHNKTHKDSDLRFDLKLGYFKNNWRTQ